MQGHDCLTKKFLRWNTKWKMDSERPAFRGKIINNFLADWKSSFSGPLSSLSERPCFREEQTGQGVGLKSIRINRDIKAGQLDITDGTVTTAERLRIAVEYGDSLGYRWVTGSLRHYKKEKKKKKRSKWLGRTRHGRRGGRGKKDRRENGEEKMRLKQKYKLARWLSG